MTTFVTYFRCSKLDRLSHAKNPLYCCRKMRKCPQNINQLGYITHNAEKQWLWAAISSIMQYTHTYAEHNIAKHNTLNTTVWLYRSENRHQFTFSLLQLHSRTSQRFYFLLILLNISDLGAWFTKLRNMNIRNSFAILSYVFRMSANRLSYEKFTKEFRKNYEKSTID